MNVFFVVLSLSKTASIDPVQGKFHIGQSCSPNGFRFLHDPSVNCRGPPNESLVNYVIDLIHKCRLRD